VWSRFWNSQTKKAAILSSNRDIQHRPKGARRTAAAAQGAEATQVLLPPEPAAGGRCPGVNNLRARPLLTRRYHSDANAGESRRTSLRTGQRQALSARPTLGQRLLRPTGRDDIGSAADVLLERRVEGGEVGAMGVDRESHVLPPLVKRGRRRMWAARMRVDDHHHRLVQRVGDQAEGLAVAVAHEETNGPLALTERHHQVARLLAHPAFVRIRRHATEMDAAIRELDEEEHVQAAQPDGVDGKKVVGDDRRNLRAEEEAPITPRSDSPAPTAVQAG